MLSVVCIAAAVGPGEAGASAEGSGEHQLGQGYTNTLHEPTQYIGKPINIRQGLISKIKVATVVKNCSQPFSSMIGSTTVTSIMSCNCLEMPVSLGHARDLGPPWKTRESGSCQDDASTNAKRATNLPQCLIRLGQHGLECRIAFQFGNVWGWCRDESKSIRRSATSQQDSRLQPDGEGKMVDVLISNTLMNISEMIQDKKKITLHGPAVL